MRTRPLDGDEIGRVHEGSSGAAAMSEGFGRARRGRRCASTRRGRATGIRRRRGSAAARRCRDAPARATGSPSPRSTAVPARTAGPASRARSGACPTRSGSTSGDRHVRTRKTRASSAGASPCSSSPVGPPRPRARRAERFEEQVLVAGLFEDEAGGHQPVEGLDHLAQVEPGRGAISARLLAPSTSAATTLRRSSSASRPTSSPASSGGPPSNAWAGIRWSGHGGDLRASRGLGFSPCPTSRSSTRPPT